MEKNKPPGATKNQISKLKSTKFKEGMIEKR